MKNRCPFHLGRLWSVPLTLLIVGCGAMLSGTHQNISLAVNPGGTEVSVYGWNGQLVAGPGTSPGRLSVHRPQWAQPYLVMASKDGHCPQYWITSTGISAGGWGTVLVFNGILPLWIDISTGGLYSIRPDPIAGTLSDETGCPE